MSACWRRVLPRRLLQWQEPAEFRRLLRLSRDRTWSRWYRLKWSVLVFALIASPPLGRWAVGDEPPGRFPWTVLLVSAVGTWLLMYVLVPWLERRPATVQIFETLVARHHGNSHAFWRFKDIEGCSWIHRPDFSVLVLDLRKGPRVFLGVPAGELIASADALLRERAVVPRVDETADAPQFPGGST